ncbi:frizzled-2-like [Convolutriloba macropyga]|uniref:frizzled-2-like n=1 Tax=Convolutriloba macropyga TaxID=536237 RepID=UPI003F51F208
MSRKFIFLLALCIACLWGMGLSAPSDKSGPKAEAQKSRNSNAESQLDLSITKEPVEDACIPMNKIKAASERDITADTSTICAGIQWTLTYKTNLLGDSTGSDRTTFWMGNFQPLIGLHCSSNTERFLCSLALPLCAQQQASKTVPNPKSYIIPPCKELCQQVQFGCEASMNAYGFDWPFNCEMFRSKSSQNTSDKGSENSMKNNMCVPPVNTEYDRPAVIPPDKVLIGPTDQSGNGDSESSSTFKCPDKLQTKKDLGYVFMGAEDCSAPCKEVLFSPKDYDVARYWIGGWSFVCFISSLFTFATYLVDRRRFKYPERPIMFMAFCYVFISFTFFIGFFGQKSISCSADHLSTESPSSITSSESGSNSPQPSSGYAEIVSQGIKSNVLCTLSFALLYYCLMASSLWWVVLTFTWLLAAGLKWSHEAIERKAFVFHAFAWVVPFFLTLLVPLFNGVEGDDISGTCFTGMLNPDFTLYFVLTPLVISLALGFTFLVFGFVSLCRVRHFIKKNGDRTDKLEKLMIRIGVFSLFYMAPAIILVSCFLYEYRYRRSWQNHWWHSRCSMYQKVGEYDQCLYSQQSSQMSQNGAATMDLFSDTSNSRTTANFYVFLLRYFVTLAVGVTSSFWLWSKKTFDSWKNVLCMNAVSTAASNNPLFAANAPQTVALSKKLTAVNSPPGGVNGAQGANGVTSIINASNHPGAGGGNLGRKAQLNTVPGAAFV